MSVPLSAWNNSAPTGWNFMKFDIRAFLANLSRKYQYTFLSYLAQFFLEREMFQTEVVEKIKTRILCSITSPPPTPEIVPFMR